MICETDIPIVNWFIHSMQILFYLSPSLSQSGTTFFNFQLPARAAFSDRLGAVTSTLFGLTACNKLISDKCDILYCKDGYVFEVKSPTSHCDRPRTQHLANDN